MKIYLNREPVFGPWGGGNKTVTQLATALMSAGHQVVYNLRDSDIDVLFCFDPRYNKYGEWYQDILNYKEENAAKIVQRVGDLGTHGKPELTNLVEQTINFSDFVIFPSEWAKEYSGFKGENYKVIHNAPLAVFHDYKKDASKIDGIELITHHWSTNPKKGFEFYRYIDEHVVGEGVNFTYIGRLPSNFKFKNSTFIEATGDNTYLAKKLASSDLYITASEEEAGANHVLEALAAGLPVVYHSNGGSIDDYCRDFGVCFNSQEELQKGIELVLSQYSKFKQRVLQYDNVIEKVVDEYLEIIHRLA